MNKIVYLLGLLVFFFSFSSYADKFDPNGTSARLGVGFSTFTSKARGDCLTYKKVTAMKSRRTGRGQNLLFDFKMISKKTELQNELGIGAGLSYGLGPLSAGVKGRYVRNVKTTRSTLFAVVKVSVVNQVETLKSPKLKQSALNLLKNGKYKFFYRRCGDVFVRSFQSGGEFIAVIHIEMKSSSKKSKVQASIQAGWGMWRANGSISNMKRALNQAGKYTIRMFRKGDNSVLPNTNLASILRYARAFPSKLRGQLSYPIVAETGDYSIVDNFPAIQLPSLSAYPKIPK